VFENRSKHPANTSPKRRIYRTPNLARYYRLSDGQLYPPNTKTEGHQLQLKNDCGKNEGPALFYDQY